MNSIRSITESVIKTLPISYYVGRKVRVALTDDSTSHYLPLIDEIRVSYQNIERAASNLESVDESNLERVIRSILYHEVSHAIFTPDQLPHYMWWRANTRYNGVYISTEDLKVIMNIVEDSRIELLGSSLFYNTNFTELVHLMNPETSDKDDSYMNKFYDLVRLGKGPTEFIVATRQVLRSSVQLTKSSHSQLYDYIDRCIDLYTSYVNYLKSLESPSDEDGQSDKASSDSSESKSDDSSNESNSMSQDSASSDQGTDSVLDPELSSEDNVLTPVDATLQNEVLNSVSSSFDTHAEADDKVRAPQVEDDDDITNEESSDPLDEFSEDDQLIIANHAKSIANDTLSKYIDLEFRSKVMNILNKSQRRVGQQSKALPSYSGVFDPRLAARDDYRFFTQKSRQGHLKSYSKMILNLYIDVSGSFYESETPANCILNSLIECSRTNPDFSLNVVLMQNGEKVLDYNGGKRIQCGGGNLLDDNIFKIARSLNRPDSFSRNIVLFDGDALSCTRHKSLYAKNFRAFNSPNTVIISDSDNSSYINKYAPNARCKIVSTNYVSELKDNVLQALAFLFN